LIASGRVPKTQRTRSGFTLEKLKALSGFGRKT
jgi:hypothetical protein